MSYYPEPTMILDENNIYSYPFPYGFVTPVYYDPYTYPITPQSQPSQCSQPGPLTASPAVLFSQPESVYPESGCLSADSLRPSPTPMYQSPIPLFPSPAMMYPSPTPSSNPIMASQTYEQAAQQHSGQHHAAQQHHSSPSHFFPENDPSVPYQRYSAPTKTETPVKKRSRTAQACEKCRIRKAKCSGLSPCNRCIIKKLPCVYATTNRIRHKALEHKAKPSRKSDKTCPPTALGLELYPVPEPAYYHAPDFKYRAGTTNGLYQNWPQ